MLFDHKTGSVLYFQVSFFTLERFKLDIFAVCFLHIFLQDSMCPSKGVR